MFDLDTMIHPMLVSKAQAKITKQIPNISNSWMQLGEKYFLPQSSLKHFGISTLWLFDIAMEHQPFVASKYS